MPNTKSAIRRVKRVKKQSLVNKLRRSRYRLAIKKINKLIEKKDEKRMSEDTRYPEDGPGINDAGTAPCPPTPSILASPGKIPSYL